MAGRSGLVLAALGVLAVGPAAAQTQVDQRTATLRGTVAGTFQSGRSPLAHATVEASRGEQRWTTATDSTGRYIIDGLPSGDVTVRASYPGHASVELVVALPSGGEVDIDLELLAEPIVLSPLSVLSLRDEEAEIPEPGTHDVASEGTRAEIEMQTLDLSPGVAQSGLIDAIGGLGGNEPADPTDVLFMRGSTSDLRLVLLDGVPVYTPFHVAGLLKSFEPAVLATADLHVGGAPARYDGGLTHILDLRTRRARRDRVHASGALDFLTASAAVETPLGRNAGIIASGRALHDLGEGPLQAQRPYGYRDGLLALDAEPASGHFVRATGFWNSEAVLLGYPEGPDEATWGNRAGSATWVRESEGARFQVSAGGSGYSALLPLQPTPTTENQRPAALLATAATERLRIVAEAAWGSADAPWRAGLSYERMQAAYKAEALSGEGATSETRGRSATLGAFAEATHPLAPGLTVRAGMRADHFTGSGARLAPRAALLVDVGPDALLTVAAGRYHQPTRTPGPEVEHTLAEVAETGLTAAELMPVATADHVVLSLRQRFGTAVGLDLGGFWKRYQGLRADPDETVLSSGVDLRLMSSGERVSGWLGYGLSWFWSGIDLTGRTGDFAGRHLLTMGLAGQVAGPIRGEARMSYGAGLPYTSIPFAQPASVQDEATAGGDPDRVGVTSASPPPIVEGLDESFLRIDIEVHALFEPVWGGRPWSVRPYLRILNALDRRDALFYSFQPWRGSDLTPLAERSVLPLFGVAFSF